jgi:hypothetical protein
VGNFDERPWGISASAINTQLLPQRLSLAGVTARTDAEVVEVTEAGVVLRDGEVLPAALVVLALGRRPSDGALTTGLREAGVDVVTVGSADRPGRVMDAIHGAFFAARVV